MNNQSRNDLGSYEPSVYINDQISLTKSEYLADRDYWDLVFSEMTASGELSIDKRLEMVEAWAPQHLAEARLFAEVERAIRNAKAYLQR